MGGSDRVSVPTRHSGVKVGCPPNSSELTCTMESPEYRALRRGSSLLKSGINPDDIVSLLSDHDLLTPDERCRANATNLTAPKRMEEVHSALERRVIVRWETFHTILAILKSVPALGPVAEELHELYKKEGGTRPLAVDISTPDPIIPAAPAG